MMEWAIDDGDVRIATGDAVARLREMPERSVQCVVTSPPFWSLRDYDTGRWEGGDAECTHEAAERRVVGNNPSAKSTLTTNNGRGPKDGDKYAADGGSTVFVATCPACGAMRADEQIGLEATPEEWAARLVEVFREVRRVLRDDGTMWVECGDTYAGGGGYSPGSPSNVARQQARANGDDRDGAFAVRGEHNYEARQRSQKSLAGLKPKDLVGAPWLLAFALRADGWYLRSEVVWAKPNAMPQSATDRPTVAHSTIFLLTKKSRYFYDQDGIREPTVSLNPAHASYRPNSARIAVDGRKEYRDGKNDVSARSYNPAGRNARSVWSIPTEPTPFAHFATFPQELVRRCILAGTSERGQCPSCGAPWTRVTETDYAPANHHGTSLGTISSSTKQDAREACSDGTTPGYRAKLNKQTATTGWAPTCTCHRPDAPPSGTPYPYPLPPVPQTVLDPFMGSGTTAVVARRLGRHAVGVELNEKYVHDIARPRLAQLSLLAGTVDP